MLNPDLRTRCVRFVAEGKAIGKALDALRERGEQMSDGLVERSLHAGTEAERQDMNRKITDHEDQVVALRNFHSAMTECYEGVEAELQEFARF